jgi:hypothetical protein
MAAHTEDSNFSHNGQMHTNNNAQNNLTSLTGGGSVTFQDPNTNMHQNHTTQQHQSNHQNNHQNTQNNANNAMVYGSHLDEGSFLNTSPNQQHGHMQQQQSGSHYDSSQSHSGSRPNPVGGGGLGGGMIPGVDPNMMANLSNTIGEFLSLPVSFVLFIFLY